MHPPVENDWKLSQMAGVGKKVLHFSHFLAMQYIFVHHCTTLKARQYQSFG